MISVERACATIIYILLACAAKKMRYIRARTKICSNYTEGRSREAGVPEKQKKNRQAINIYPPPPSPVMHEVFLSFFLRRRRRRSRSEASTTYKQADRQVMLAQVLSLSLSLSLSRRVWYLTSSGRHQISGNGGIGGVEKCEARGP